METRNRIINLASGSEVTILYIINKIVELMEFKGKITYQPKRPGDVRRHVGDINLARRILHYEPKTNFTTGLKFTIDWYRDNFKR
jgi:nucleoside-diphosphate-sugar epimerase